MFKIIVLLYSVALVMLLLALHFKESIIVLLHGIYLIWATIQTKNYIKNSGN